MADDGNLSGNVSTDLEGWQWEEGRAGSNDWHAIICSDPVFMDQVRTRWQQLRPGILSDAEIDGLIDSFATPLITAGPRDVARWPVGECGYFGGFGRDTQTVSGADSPTWEGQVQYLKDWIHARMAWMDSQLL